MNEPAKSLSSMSRKTDGELLAIVESRDSAPEASDAAKLELWKRHAGTGTAAEAAASRPLLSSLAVWSLVFCFMPYLGLPMAVGALHRIRRSEGKFYGRRLAWFSVAANAICLIFLLAVMALAALMG